MDILCPIDFYPRKFLETAKVVIPSSPKEENKWFDEFTCYTKLKRERNKDHLLKKARLRDLSSHASFNSSLKEVVIVEAFATGRPKPPIFL